MARKLTFLVPIRVSILASILALVVVIASVSIFTVLSISERAARQSSVQLFSQASALARQELATQLSSLREMASLGSVFSASTETELLLSFMTRALQNDAAKYSVYFGFEDGRFLQLIHIAQKPKLVEGFKTPPQTEFAFRTLPRGYGQRSAQWVYFSASGATLGTYSEPSTVLDIRSRPWYADAITSDTAILTKLYAFSSLKQMGLTAARALPGKRGVFAASMTLDNFEQFVDTQLPSANGGIAIFEEDGTLLLATSSIKPLLDGQRLNVNEQWLSQEGNWKMEDRTLKFLVASPLADFNGNFRRLQTALLIFSVVLLVVSLVLGLLFGNHITRVLTTIAADAQRVRALDFSGTVSNRSHIIEFRRLSDEFLNMKATLSQRTDELHRAMEKLELVVELGIAMSVEQDINKLAETILQGAKGLTHADGGSLYLKSPGAQLDFQIVLNDTLGIHQGGTSPNPILLPSVSLFGPNGEPNHNNVVSHSFHAGQTVNIEDAYEVVDFDFSGTRAFDAANHYRSKSILTVPLRPRGGEVIGALQLINASEIGPDGKPTSIPFGPEARRFVESLAAEAATALYNRELLETQKRLFDAMIQFIAGAIDAKSHYTGAHCLRVPELALMIAEEASAAEDGPLAGFSFKSPEEWYEFKVGAWLHDCGKVTTPEFVVDKASKLETINNRIHEVRMRFEVLLRDAEIQRLSARISGSDLVAADKNYAHTLEKLQDDFAFVASCNSGDEFMSSERIERLNAISQQTWIRNFDDRLGLSWEEQNRFEAIDRCALPCTEQLLADKPEHIIPRNEDFYQRYAGLGFTLPVPENLYNNGEIYNLSVPRGTLNTEERFKINEHIMQTIVMLERLPLPSNLSRVPQYAGTHHETLTGSGYPRNLRSGRLGIPERIMAIADIFEALTAADRPYKKAKTLSESVKILHGFKKDGHIDSDVFDLFLTSGVYRRYAEKNLKPSQIDEVEIEQFLGRIAVLS